MSQGAPLITLQSTLVPHRVHGRGYGRMPQKLSVPPLTSTVLMCRLSFLLGPRA